MGDYRQPLLKDLLASAFPCIHLPTADTRNAKNKIRRASISAIKLSGFSTKEREQARFAVWTITDGIKEFFLTPQENVRTGIETPVQIQARTSFTKALEWVRTAYCTSLVMVNPREYMRNPENIQKIIDVSQDIKATGSHIFLLGPDIEIAPELQGTVYTHDFGLPTREEMADLCVREIILSCHEILDDIEMPETATKQGALIGKGLKKLVGEIYETNKAVIDKATEAAAGLSTIEAENAFAISANIAGKLDPRIIQDAKKQAIKQTDVLEFISNDELMENVGGFGAYKEWLELRKGAFSPEAKAFGVTSPKGVLLVGPSGSGKSLVGKATAATLGLPLLRFDISKVFHHLVGSSESRMRTALRVAEAVAPAVLWMDEIEKGIAGSDGSNDSGVAARILGQFLQWRQETTADLFICCTCNNVHSIPMEFYRPGRIDAVFATALPTQDERQEILKIHLRRRGKEEAFVDIDFVEASNACTSFTGAEIELAVMDAIFVAFNDRTKALNTELIVEAAQAIVPQAVRNSEELAALAVWTKQRARSVSFNEAPHREKGSGKGRRLSRVGASK